MCFRLRLQIIQLLGFVVQNSTATHVDSFDHRHQQVVRHSEWQVLLLGYCQITSPQQMFAHIARTCTSSVLVSTKEVMSRRISLQILPSESTYLSLPMGHETYPKSRLSQFLSLHFSSAKIMLSCVMYANSHPLDASQIVLHFLPAVLVVVHALINVAQSQLLPQ